jgi:hypothetical protein
MAFLHSLTAETLTDIIHRADVKPVPPRLTRKGILKKLEDGSWRKQLEINDALLTKVEDFVLDNPLYSKTVKSLSASRKVLYRYSSDEFRSTYMTPMLCLAIAANATGKALSSIVKNMHDDTNAEDSVTPSPLLDECIKDIASGRKMLDSAAQFMVGIDALLASYGIEQQDDEVVDDSVHSNKKRKSSTDPSPNKRKKATQTRESSSKTSRKPAVAKKARNSAKKTKSGKDKA